MRVLILLAALVAPSVSAQTPPGPGVVRALYASDVRSTDMRTGAVRTEPALLVRDVDASQGLVIETLCLPAPGGHGAMVSPAYIRIREGVVTLSDTLNGPARTFTGTGRAWGAPGAWDRLQFSIDFHSGQMSAHIEDWNWLVAGNLIARKIVTIGDGRPVQLWEAEMAPVEPDPFWSRWSRMGCRAI